MNISLILALQRSADGSDTDLYLGGEWRRGSPQPATGSGAGLPPLLPPPRPLPALPVRGGQQALQVGRSLISTFVIRQRTQP